MLVIHRVRIGLGSAGLKCKWSPPIITNIGSQELEGHLSHHSLGRLEGNAMETRPNA